MHRVLQIPLPSFFVSCLSSVRFEGHQPNHQFYQNKKDYFWRMSSSPSYKQDLPPPGGYSSIPFKRVPAKTFFSGWALIGGYLGMTAGAAYLYFLNCKSVKATELEMKCASFALYPMLLAERDRAYLKQLRKNRDEETELMKNVEGWKTGTWYGEPIFYTKDPDSLTDPMYAEFYVHCSYKDFMTRGGMMLMS
ncbi:unnamed protein product [Acanthoscelides obtectus]|uniref:NADH dehydrogenase [ubiquinone] 1 alpha subcomplex subunit 13 n=1 Tax=Acanthoscelides obtectus TaxID=200917 RepID=A0A9P0M8V0_ACAOB|nr:unnamed protein product [Acanthoscelides obtectus]CAK1643591.1 NADH dehydrogenase [ubiquinone] 1 alpha subcomplex subunit 13 [Acanthoscelides obtectus]